MTFCRCFRRVIARVCELDACSVYKDMLYVSVNVYHHSFYLACSCFIIPSKAFHFISLKFFLFPLQSILQQHLFVEMQYKLLLLHIRYHTLFFNEFTCWTGYFSRSNDWNKEWKLYINNTISLDFNVLETANYYGIFVEIQKNGVLISIFS